MTKLEFVINEVIIKTKSPLPSNRRDCKWRTNHINVIWQTSLLYKNCCISVFRLSMEIVWDPTVLF